MPKDTAANSAKAGQEKQGCQIAIGIGLVVMVIFALSQCDSKKSSTISAEQPFGAASVTNQIEAMTPASEVKPFAPGEVTRAARHLRMAMANEGFSGAMIYSQSCYDGLSQRFSWSQLDRCGAFDLLAVRLGDRDQVQDLTNELEYFSPEPAAARYLALATKAGEQPESADLRLEALRARVSATPLPQAAAPEPKVEDPTELEGEAVPAATPRNETLDSDWLDQMTGKTRDETG